MSEPICPSCQRPLPAGVASGPPQAVLRCAGCAALLLWSNGKVVRTAKAGSTVAGMPAVKPPAPGAAARESDDEPPLSELRPEEERPAPSAVPQARVPAAPGARPAAPPAPAAPKRTILGLPTPAPAPKREPSAPIPVAKQPSAPIPVARQPSVPIPVAKQPSASIPVAKQPSAPIPVAKQPSASIPVAKQPSAPIPVAKQPSAPIPVAKSPPATRSMIAQVVKAPEAAPGPLVDPQAWFHDPTGSAPRPPLDEAKPLPPAPAPLPPPPSGPGAPPPVIDLLGELTPALGVEAIPEPIEPLATLAMPTVAPPLVDGKPPSPLSPAASARSTLTPATHPLPSPAALSPPPAALSPPPPTASPPPPAAASFASLTAPPAAASPTPPAAPSLAAPTASEPEPEVVELPTASLSVESPAAPAAPAPLNANAPPSEPAPDDFGLFVAQPAQRSRKALWIAVGSTAVLLFAVGIGVTLHHPAPKVPPAVAAQAPAATPAPPAPAAPTPPTPAPAAPTPPTSAPAAAPPTNPPATTPSPAPDPDPPAVPSRPHNRRLLGGKKVVLEYDPKPADPPPPVATPTGEDPGVVARARAAYHRGNQRLFGGDDAGAVSAYREALRIYPGYVAGYRGLGLAYEEQGQKDQALEALRTYVRTVPNARDVGLIRKRIAHLESK